jgi:hypothetical protein
MQYPSVKANGFCMMTLAALLRELARNLLSKSVEETIRRFTSFIDIHLQTFQVILRLIARTNRT